MKRKRVFGKTVKELNGLMNKNDIGVTFLRFFYVKVK